MTATLAEPGYDAAEMDAAVQSWELVQRVQAGDNDAYGEIFRLHYPSVLRYIRYRVTDAHLAEDLAADTFLRGLRRIDSFTWQGRNFGAYLTTIAHNIVVDYFRSGRCRLEVVCDEPHDVHTDPSTGRVTRDGHGPVDPSTGPDEAVVERLTLLGLRGDLLDALMRLSPEQRQVLVLRFFNGMSTAETARVLGKQLGAVKALQYRAVRSMARLLPAGLEW